MTTAGMVDSFVGVRRDGLNVGPPSSTRGWAVQDGPNEPGAPSDGGGCRQALVHVTGGYRGKVGMGWDPRGDDGAISRIAGIAYTGSNSVQDSERRL